MFNNLLAICIPTFNRADKLNAVLGHLIKNVKQYNIPIYISDNASTDDTATKVQEHMKEYKHLVYSKNEENIGPDLNFEKALKLSKCHYSWLMGDDDFIIFDNFENILLKLKVETPNLVVVNSRNQVIDKLPSKYTCKQKLLIDLGWHITFISCLIFSKISIHGANFKSYYNSGFVHVGAIFDYLSKIDDVNVIWLEDSYVTTLRTYSDFPSWYPKLLQVFAENWVNVIFSLPIQYDATSKIETVIRLWEKSSIISLKSFVLLRAYSLFSKSEYQKYKINLNLLYGNKKILIYLISILPIWMISRPVRSRYKMYVKKRILESELESKKLFNTK